MTSDRVGALAWLTSAGCAVFVAVASAVSGNWLAAMGWAVGAAGSLGAAGQTARIAVRRRDTWDTPWSGSCPLGDCQGDARYSAPGHGHRPGCPYPIPRLDPNNPGWEDHPDDGAPRRD